MALVDWPAIGLPAPRRPPGRPAPDHGEGWKWTGSALTAWLDVAQDPDGDFEPPIFAAMEDASNRLSADARAGRHTTLEDLALQRTPYATARATLATLAWADGALHHAWRLAESLRIASGK